MNIALTNEGYDIEHNRYPEGYQEAPLAYDAVWSVALAFNKTMDQTKGKKKHRSLKDFTYTDRETADEIYAAMNSTSFLGVSVSSNENTHTKYAVVMVDQFSSFRKRNGNCAVIHIATIYSYSPLNDSDIWKLNIKLMNSHRNQ